MQTLATLHPDARDVLDVAGRVEAELRRVLRLPADTTPGVGQAKP
ncbi:hypothetical protein [Streptomyces sp. MA5143a]|nr:hypothetical protein [Streptomyces sp. MA5143a]